MAETGRGGDVGRSDKGGDEGGDEGGGEGGWRGSGEGGGEGCIGARSRSSADVGTRLAHMGSEHR